MASIEDLEESFRSAQAATEAYSQEITEKYRREYPRTEGETGLVDPQLLVERAGAWTDAEREHLDSLRQVAREAAVVLSRARQEARGHTAGE